ncbi:MAG: alkaline phosphatase PhoX, partial [Gemmatimonadota bacterium]
GAREGFPSGYFFTGEESVGGVHDGMQLAVGTDGNVHELPWIGRFAHENLTAVPYRNKVVVFGTDDTSGASELYMYIGNTEADVINGSGKLYVLKGRTVSRSGDLQPGEPVTGDWVEVQNPASLSSGGLQAAVNGLGAFAFIRLEDSDYDHRPGARPALFFVDTGAPVLCNGTPCDAFGSIYRLDINTTDPTGPARLFLLARSKGAQSGWSSPDNIAAGTRSLMVNEDPANATFAGQRAPQIWQFGYTSRGITDGHAVVELANPGCDDVAGTCWESTGIIDASAWFGQGAWLFSVQAHTLPAPGANIPREGGQLLLLRVQGS